MNQRPSILALLLVACNPNATTNATADEGEAGGRAEVASGTSTTTGGGIETPPEPEPEPEIDRFDPGPGKPADPPSAAEIDAPIASELPPLAFWEKGDAACEPGGRLEGALPPAATEIRCVDAEGRWTGMEARFHEGLPVRLQMIGRKRDGRMEGVWLWFDAGGAKIAEHPYTDGQLHGTLRRWAANGQEIETAEYRVGRAWGLSVIRDETGKELARSQLDRGTGVLIGVDSFARTESDYVNGLLHGEHRRFDRATGTKLAESAWSGGDWHGPQTTWDPQGNKTSESHWKLGRRHGVATRWEAGQIVERSIHVEGDEHSRQLYREGEPLAPLPAPTACDEDSGLSTMLLTARGRGLPDEHACVDRSPLFPGVIRVGDFAYDRGCMSEALVVDCQLRDPKPGAPELLGRAGWARATPEQRIVIAQEYLDELEIGDSGSISSTPDEPVWTSLADGGVEAVVWVAEPAGMRRGRELDKLRFRFASDGALTREPLEHRSED
ncbi:toxin-antitoxin system YwqK family antitoxin [Nannocystaceae bacterium ST9]